MTSIHKDKIIGYRPPPDVRKILESIPKGKRSEAISKAIRMGSNISEILEALEFSLTALNEWKEFDPENWSARDIAAQNKINKAIERINHEYKS